MKRIGLTGNIGTGKSTVAQVFGILGIPVYHADKQSRMFLQSDEVKTQIVELFGLKVLDQFNQIDRKILASIVFSDKVKLASLNDLIHPLVEQDFEQWCSKHTENKYILHEAAILFESGFNRLFDATILVTAPEELCIKRVMARDNDCREMIADRMRNQWPQEKKKELADYLVVNDEVSMVLPQVLAIHRRISL